MYPKRATILRKKKKGCPFDDDCRSSAIDRNALNYNDAKEKLKKYLINTGRYDEDIASLIQYELIHCLIKISDKYLETIMVFKKILKMSAQKTPIQKYMN